MLITASQFVTHEKPLMTGAMSVYPYSTTLDALLTFQTQYGDIIKMGVREGNTLKVPRHCCPYADHNQDFQVSYPLSAAIDCKFEPLNDEQKTLPEQSIQLLKNGQNHIFDAPTGWGKTVVGSYIAARMGQPTMIIVTKEDLLDQWYDALVNVLKIDPALVGRVQGDTCNWKGKMFVLGMVQSLIITDRYPPEMYNYFGMVILDEVHLMAADCFVRSCQFFPARYRLGFSATPIRKDGKSKLLWAHIGPVKVRGTILPMKPKIIVRKTGWKIPQHRNSKTGEWVSIPYSPGRMTMVTKALANNALRNQEIVNFVTQAYHKDRKTLILSDLLDGHLVKLFHLLTKAGIPGNDIGYYIGGMTKENIESNKVRRVVLGTYKMCATGTNVPEWDTLVMASPRADVKQPLGRVLRYMIKKKQPIALDLVDSASIFENFHLSRLKTYYELGAEVVSV